MYISDYGYAASPIAWSLVLNSYNNSTATNNNWMYMGYYEWAISRASDDTDIAFDLSGDGNVRRNALGSRYGIRPTFYLNLDVKINGGTGTSSNPYRITD